VEEAVAAALASVFASMLADAAALTSAPAEVEADASDSVGLFGSGCC